MEVAEESGHDPPTSRDKEDGKPSSTVSSVHFADVLPQPSSTHNGGPSSTHNGGPSYDDDRPAVSSSTTHAVLGAPDDVNGNPSPSRVAATSSQSGLPMSPKSQLPHPQGSTTMTHDRRHQSEALFPSKMTGRPQSMIIASRTRKPSVVTGGYESTDSDSEGKVKARPKTSRIPSSQSVPHGLGSSSKGQNTKAVKNEDATPGSDTTPLSDAAARPMGAKLLYPRSLSLRTPLHDGLSRSTSVSRNPSFSQKNRDASTGSHLTGKRLPSRLQPNLERSTSPGSQRQDAVGGASSPDSTRKGKEKARGLAASLGIDGQSQAILTPDQINALFADADFDAVYQRSTDRTGESSTTRRESVQRPQQPAPRNDPYVVKAPPALLRDEVEGRSRGVSDASMTAPFKMRWQSPDKSEGHHRRGMSVSTVAEKPAFQTNGDAEIAEEGDNATEDEEHARETPQPLEGSTPQRSDSARSANRPRESKGGEGGMNWLGQVLRRKSKKEKHLLAEDDDWRSSLSSRGEDPKPIFRAKDSDIEEGGRDAKMIRVERQRRQEELDEEREAKAREAVWNHPEARRYADRVITHFDSYYDLVFDGLENPPRLNLLAVIRWRSRSEEQTARRAHWERTKQARSAASDGMQSERMRSTSSLGSRPLSSDPSLNLSNQPGRRWTYSIEDILAYKRSSGKVEYFEPPLEALSAQVSPSEPLSTSTKDEGIIETVTSPVETNRSIRSGRVSISSMKPLSRVSSNDPPAKMGHRSNQSLGSLGQGSLTHALKSSIGTLNNRIRNNTSTSLADMNNGHADPDPLRSQHSPSHSSHALSSISHKISKSIGNVKDAANGSHGDQDHPHDFSLHVKSLFPKGPDARRSLDARSNRDLRAAELRDLRAAILASNETAVQEQASRENLRGHTNEADLAREIAENAAEERRDRAEMEDLVRRRENLDNARRRLAMVDRALIGIDETMQHYIMQCDQLSNVAQTSYEVKAEFAHVEGLRKTYRPTKKRSQDAPFLHRSDEEASDVLAPLRFVSGNDSPTGADAHRPRRQSSFRNRRSSVPASLPSLLSFGVHPLPRRSSLDPKGRTRVNPMKRLELNIDHAREQQGEMLRERQRTESQLQSVINDIEKLIVQKDHMRAFLKRNLDEIMRSRWQVDWMRAKLRGNSSARWKQRWDRTLNSIANGVGFVLKIGFGIKQFAYHDDLGWHWIRLTMAGIACVFIWVLWSMGDQDGDRRRIDL